MRFLETSIPGAIVIEPELRVDDRGFFARTFCREEMAAHGISMEIIQCNISYNRRRGTLRGMHYQVAPMAEAKIVRCTKGRIYDVIVDLRRASRTFCRWASVELGADDRRMLYIPEGLAHGFVTLEDGAEVFYEMSQFYSPEHARGVRWDDPAFGIRWPINNPIMSEKDRNYEDFPL